MLQAFISHSSKDQAWVEWIAHEIEALSVRPYLAQHDPKPGELLSEKVRRAIAESDVVIVLLTPNGYSSPYVQQEVGVATAQGKLIIPLVHPDVEGASLALLNGLEYIAFDFQTLPSGSADLISRLRDIAQKHQRERILDGVILATLFVTVLYAVAHPADAPGTVAIPSIG